MSTSLIHYAAAAASDRGRKRPSNEDSFAFSVENGIYLVCDGMGGAAAGEVASSIAVDEMLRLLTPAPEVQSVTEGKELPELVTVAIAATNEAIFSRSQRNERLSGMGTTLVGLLVNDRQAWVVNVGDSRCYLLRNHKLEQITLDHSLVEEQVRLGRMTRSEALRSPLRNVITRALGTQCQVTPDFFEVHPGPGDLFLLCSDGLTRELSDSLIESILLLDLPLEIACNRLVESAKRAGGHDNITCILVRADG